MNSVDSAYHSQSQSASTPSLGTPDPKATLERFSGDKVKMSNSTPNGYSSVSSYKVKSDEHSKKHHHDLSKSSDYKHSNSSQHNSDHVKKKDGDSSKHSSSSKSKDSLNKLNKSSSDIQKSKEHHEKKHEHSKSSPDKLKKEKSASEKSSHNSLKKIDKHRDDKHKEKTKDSHSSEHKHNDKTKEHDRTKDDKLKDPSKVKKIDGHKDKPRDKSIDKGDKLKEKSDKPKEKSDKPREKSGERPKEKNDKPKDKIDKPKQGDKPKEKEKHRDKSDKPKDKSDKPKEKSHDKPKEKSKENSDKSKDKIGDKSKDKIGDKLKEKAFDNLKDKKRESSPEKKISSPQKDHSKKNLETSKAKPQPTTSPVKSPVKSDFSSPLNSPNRIKDEIFSDDDIPLSTRKPVRVASKPIKREFMDEESDDEPLSARISKVKKVKTEKSTTKKRKAESEDEEYDSDYKKPKKKLKKETKPKATVKKEETVSPKKGRAKKEDDKDVWKWWEEEKHEDGIKWRTLEHKGPVFAPLYDRVPKNVKFYYDGKHIELSEVTEEVAGFYGRMLDHDYTTKVSFNTNFFKDWRKVMTPQEREIIKDLKKCNFKDFDIYYKQKSEERKSMTKEEKQEIKKQNAEMMEEYGFCIIDGHRQKIGNFKIEPPGLFRGRGEHPKMGMLKRRVQPEDILINIGRDAKVVPQAPAGHKWKEIRHDNTVTWLASWNENILNSTKYIMLNPSSKLKGEKDWQKYETARKLKNHAERIRNTYEQDFKSKEMKVRQRAVALYFIDKLALRAGNEKDEDTADTVGCCSLRVEHITLDEEKDGLEYVVGFDFLGKDSIRYENTVAVEKRAFKNLKLFMENKQPGDDLFDRLNTSILNKYLTELMDGLTAKVFRTYNASKTLQEQLDLLTKEEMSVPEKLLAYNRANRSVAVLCNHQRAVPKTFDKSMENLKNKIEEKLQQIKTVKKELKQLKSDAKNSGSSKDKLLVEKKKKRLQQLEEQLQKLEVQATDKEENKQIALGTSKLNYLDPRISVAWCKKWEVPIEKIYNRTQRDKFRWAIEMAGPEFQF